MVVFVYVTCVPDTGWHRGGLRGAPPPTSVLRENLPCLWLIEFPPTANVTCKFCIEVAMNTFSAGVSGPLTQLLLPHQQPSSCTGDYC
ncbi:hypothetical protein JYU34_020784 [Plutella xylostella]|uniref:Secreted protein n=1 Tax=Plutella xylostella TaxID=51655 RepID=A0ABQ7PRY1_PLUXY|nr:hypothetical protein JYU34_020784 [Plutella xylostella]